MWHIRIGFLFIFVLGIQQISNAQASQEKKDSLLQFLDTYVAEDSVRVNALVDLQEFYLVDDYEKGFPFIEEALDISRSIDYETGEGFSLNALGAFYLKKGDNEAALEYTLAAIQLFERIGEDQNIYAAYNNLALIYKRLNKLEKAAETYMDMLARLEGKPESPSFVVVYYNLASTYQAMGEMGMYEDWLQQMLDLAEKLNFPLGIVEGRLGLAQIAVSRGEFEHAFNMSSSLLPQLQAMSMAQPQARAYKISAASLHGLNRLPEALTNARKAEEIYLSINDPTQLIDLLTLKATIFNDLGRYKDAFETSERYHELQDSLLSEIQIRAIEELQTKYETARIEKEKNEAEIANLQLLQQNQRSRSLLLGSLALLFFGVIGGFAYNRQQQLIKKSELKDIELRETQKRLIIETQKRQAELKAIRSQLNPHFIFNLMNSVQGYIVTGNAEKATKSLSLVSSLMQRTLEHSRRSLVTLQDELDLVNEYIKAENMRFEDELTLTTELDDEIDAEFIQIPPMLIQPYVENAVKHGLRNKNAGDKQILIRVQPESDDYYSLSIQDNGVGRKAASMIASNNPGEHNNFSTGANELRLKTISEQTGSTAEVVIHDLEFDGEPAGTQVMITLPFEMELT